MADTPKTTDTRTSAFANQVLLRPRITEKAYAVNALDQYVFQVAPKATKSDVRRAVEEVYGVHVTNVNMVKLQGKIRRLGRTAGKRSGVKKAIVTVKKGESITLFKAGI